MSLGSSGDGHQKHTGRTAVDLPESSMYSLFPDAPCKPISATHLARRPSTPGRIRPGTRHRSQISRRCPASLRRVRATTRVQHLWGFKATYKRRKSRESPCHSFVVHSGAPFANSLREESSRLIRARWAGGRRIGSPRTWNTDLLHDLIVYFQKI